MKFLDIIKSKFTWIAATAAIAGTVALSNCGGGGGGGSDNATIRPKSLNGLEISLDNNAVTIQFVRSAISSSAINNGQIEEGAVRFTQVNSSVSRQMLDGNAVDVQYPATTSRITYRYRALNETSGLLQILCARAGYNADAGPNPLPNRIFYYSTQDAVSTTNYFLTFGSDGNTITDVQVRVAPNTVATPLNFIWETYTPVGATPLWTDISAEKTVQESLTYLIDANLSLIGGGPVEVNYDSVDNDDPNLQSSIAVSTLDKKTLFFIPDNPAFDNFSAAHTVTSTNTIDFTEQGQVLVFDDENNVQIGSGNYTYDLINGTDDAELVYSGNTGEDNRYILNFRSLESAEGAPLTQRASGFYEIQGGLQSGETGFFFLRDDVNLGGPNN